MARPGQRYRHGWIRIDGGGDHERSADKLAASAGISGPGAPSGLRSADRLAAAVHGGGGMPTGRERASAEHIESTLNDALANGRTTDRMFTVGGDGQTWTPERAAQHKQLLDDLWARDGDSKPRERQAVIAGGLGGAGKSTVLKGEIDQSRYLTLNPDDMKEEMAKRGMIPEVPGLSPMEAAATVHEESSYLTNQLARRAYKDGTNVVWDITMSSKPSVEKRLTELGKNGYKTQAVFVDIPVETSVQRAMARWERGAEQYAQGKGFGGRYVPPRIIRANAVSGASSANRQVFDALQPQFGSWSLYDNSGSAPKRIGESK